MDLRTDFWQTVYEASQSIEGKSWHRRGAECAVQNERNEKWPHADLRAVTSREGIKGSVHPGRFTRALLQVFRKKVVLVGAVDGKSL